MKATDAFTDTKNMVKANENGTSTIENLPQMANLGIIPSILIKVEKDSDDDDYDIIDEQVIETPTAANPIVVNDVKPTNSTESNEQHQVNNVAEEMPSAAVNFDMPESISSTSAPVTTTMTEEEISRRIKSIIAAANQWQKNFESTGRVEKRKGSADGEETVTIKRVKLEEFEMSSEEEG